MQTRRKWRHIASCTHEDPALSHIKWRVLTRVLAHCHRATPDLKLWLLFLSWHILCPGNTAVWKDNELVYCHLLTRNIASFSVQLIFDGPTHWWMSSPRFSLVDVLNCPPNMCCSLNPLDQLHKKWTLRNVLKHRLYTARWAVLALTPLSIWTTEAPSKMTTQTASAKSFTGDPNAWKPVSSFTTKTMRHIRHPPQKCNVIIPT